MIEFYRDAFDSSVFTREAYKLFIDGTVEDAEELENLWKPVRVDFISCFTSFSIANIRLLTAQGFELVSIRNEYSLAVPFRADERNPETPFALVCSAGAPPDLSPSDLDAMAAVIGATSRYAADPRFRQGECMNLYRTWLHNSLYQAYADQCFLVLHAGSLAGLLSLRIKQGVGHIDLIGVLPEFQGRGLGHVLLANALSFLREQGIMRVRVITEGENVAGSVFYQKHGFLIDSMSIVYHKHFYHD